MVLKPVCILLCSMPLIILISACSSGTEPSPGQPLPDWAAPADIHQPASTIQSPEKTVVGDLGWKSIRGVIQSAQTGNLNVEGAELTLRHHSIVHPPGIELTTQVGADGSYMFPEIFLHDTDVLILRVDIDDRPPVELRFTGEEAFHRTSVDIDLDNTEIPD